MDVGDTEKLIDDLLGTDEGKAEHDTPQPEKEQEPAQPKTATDKAGQEQTKEATDKSGQQKDDFGYRPLPHEGTESHSSQSVPTSEPSSNSAKDSLSKSSQHNPSAKSVREELRKIRESRKEKEQGQTQRDDRSTAEKTKRNPTTAHTQPKPSRIPKTKSKGTR